MQKSIKLKSNDFDIFDLIRQGRLGGSGSSSIHASNNPAASHCAQQSISEQEKYQAADSDHICSTFLPESRDRSKSNLNEVTIRCMYAPYSMVIFHPFKKLLEFEFEHKRFNVHKLNNVD